MDKNEFLLRFNLLQLPESEHNYQHHLPLRSAAVLIPLVESAEGLQVLLTKRASHLKHHPSQVSFPGGKVEPTDKSLIDTALRETFEEIGLSRQAITVVGQLQPYQTISGFHVTPIVAIVARAQRYKMDKNEVAEIFQVPLQHFLTTKDHHVFVASKNGKQHNVHFLPYKHYHIWGATAVMIKDLVAHIN
ncbi:coenzyme A pyrophosphatase [Colwellia sp. MT41]|uniref:Coenzyme A pyrophosphatase n=1 Tax=Colwellia marinimaniae TaxID=1513592 RepID=A0ABQ0MSK9_9GAMM|nr:MULTISPECIES: CoA pyrophosphatase [Colwellia]ALO35433.1 coenzyme A pyrophosphatase [Colwellia sp. MT41]GAW95334.1 coenzyme A pyrophosphatase [Colwellia marinimaniae]